MLHTLRKNKQHNTLKAIDEQRNNTRNEHIARQEVGDLQEGVDGERE